MKRILVLSLTLTLAAVAQPQHGKNHAPGRAPTRTRLVYLYTDLEKQLANAAEMQDQVKLDQLLDDDFEQWGPEPPGDPIPRDDWQNAYRPTSFTPRQMAVTAFSDTDVVSFVAHQKGTFGDKELGGDYFVVDVWRHEGNTSKLAARYISRTTESRVQPASPGVKR